MFEFIAGLAVGAATMITLGARWRRNRRRVDELHEAMLAATWAVQDLVAICVIRPRPQESLDRMEEADSLARKRDAAAARYFAAVGE